MDPQATHPFPYFGLPVTRDAAAIKKAVEAKYWATKPLEGSPTRVHEYRAFNQCADLITIKDRSTTGVYNADLAKVEAIVKRSLAPVEEYLLGLVSPHSNTIHPKQVDKCVEVGERTFGVAATVSRPHIEQLLKARSIQVSLDKPPPAPVKPPKPVEGVKAECGDGTVRLSWKLPPADCDRVKVVRTDGANPKAADSGHEAAGAQWLDPQVEPGREYTYGVFALLGSEAILSEVLKARARGTVKEFKAAAAGGKAVLTWALPPNTENVRVLRSAAPMNGDLVDVAARPLLPAGAKEVAELGRVDRFEDAGVTPGTTYYYAVLARHGVDWYSPSECKSVTIPVPPSSPGEFKATADSPGRVDLAWKPVTDHGSVEYTLARVVEKAGWPRPTPEVVGANLTAMTFADETVVPGTTYRYFLTTTAGGLRSEPPAVAGPVTPTGEIADFNAKAQAGKVLLSWRAPPGAVRVEVRRADNTPPPPGGGALGVELFPLAATSPGFADTKVTNGRTYGYRACCVYAGADGKEVVTAGQTATATPREPPALVHQLRLTAQPGGLRLGWTAPRPARVQVVRVAASPGYAVGSHHQSFGVTKLGHQLDPLDGRTDVFDPAPTPAEGVYLVFSEDGHSSVFCGEARYVELATVKARQQGTEVHVDWECPDGCTGVSITRTSGPVVKQKDVPRPPGHQRMRVVHKIAEIGPGEHAFTVRCTTDPADPAVLAGPGVTVRVKVVHPEKITWRFEQQGGYFRKGERQLVVRGERGFQRVEKLVLVGKVNRLPMSDADGTYREEWEPVPDLDGVDRRPAPAWQSRDGKVFCKLFALPAEEALVVPPEVDATKL